MTAQELAEHWQAFDALIDARTPDEFALDHLPGAINLPVLTNEERIEIGTLYKVSSFEAKKRGAAHVARNIARHLETALIDQPRHWRPLVYCWRGGNRSQAMATVFERIGWKAQVLEGGYAEFRRFLTQDLSRLASTFQYRVVCGVTGSGKSQFLRHLANEGEQILDLEALAHHRGSLLGAEPVGSQPSQKSFETQIWDRLRALDPSRPVYVESESRKIGQVQVPAALIERMRNADCIELRPRLADRVDFLCREYAHFFEAPKALSEQLSRLKALVGAERLQTWDQLIEQRQWPKLVEDLLISHYDPAYQKSMAKNYRQIGRALHISAHGNQREALLAIRSG